MYLVLPQYYYDQYDTFYTTISQMHPRFKSAKEYKKSLPDVTRWPSSTMELLYFSIILYF